MPKLLKIKREKVGIRIPDEPITLAILDHYEKPLVVSSVPPNANGEPYQMGYSIFETYGHGIDMLVDLGEELSGALTTVADLSDGVPTLIREGAGEWPYS